MLDGNCLYNVYQFFYKLVWDIFQMSGNIPQSTQFLSKIDKGSVTTESQIFSIRIEVPLWPWALFTFKSLIILRILSLLNLIVVNLLWVMKYSLEGKTLLLETGVHWEEKKTLKSLDFPVKSDTT